MGAYELAHDYRISIVARISLSTTVVHLNRWQMMTKVYVRGFRFQAQIHPINTLLFTKLIT